MILGHVAYSTFLRTKTVLNICHNLFIYYVTSNDQSPPLSIFRGGFIRFHQNQEHQQQQRHPYPPSRKQQKDATDENNDEKTLTIKEHAEKQHNPQHDGRCRLNDDTVIVRSATTKPSMAVRKGDTATELDELRQHFLINLYSLEFFSPAL